MPTTPKNYIFFFYVESISKIEFRLAATASYFDESSPATLIVFWPIESANTQQQVVSSSSLHQTSTPNTLEHVYRACTHVSVAVMTSTMRVRDAVLVFYCSIN